MRMPSPRQPHHGDRRGRVECEERDKHHDPRTDQRRFPWSQRPRDPLWQENNRRRVSPRRGIRVTRGEGKTGEPPDSPRHEPRKRGRNWGETGWYEENHRRPPSLSHEPNNRGHHRRDAGNEGPAGNSAGEKGGARGQCGAIGKDAGNMLRWEVKRRRSAAVLPSVSHLVPRKESFLPLQAKESEAGEPQLPQNPYHKERLLLEAEIAAVTTGQWLLDDYLPTAHLNEALLVSTGTNGEMRPRSEASSSGLPGNALQADNREKEGRDGTPPGEERERETWGQPALDLRLAGEGEPILSPP